jgi:hypothetical protein
MKVWSIHLSDKGLIKKRDGGGKKMKARYAAIALAIIVLAGVALTIGIAAITPSARPTELEITHVIFVGQSEDSNNSIIVSVRNNYNKSITITTIIYGERYGTILESKNVSFSGNPTIKPGSTTVLTLSDVGWLLIKDVDGNAHKFIQLITDDEIFTENVYLRGW